MRSLPELIASMQAALADIGGYWSFVDNNGDCYGVLDGKISRTLTSNNVHTLAFLSTWSTGQQVQTWFDVKADKSGIVVWGIGFDDNAPVTETEIVHVLPSGAFVSLAKSPNNTCSADWPLAAMTAGNNEVMFFMTSKAGRYGATTRLSKPQS